MCRAEEDEIRKFHAVSVRHGRVIARAVGSQRTDMRDLEGYYGMPVHGPQKGLGTTGRIASPFAEQR
jgi:hypothetical protein